MYIRTLNVAFFRSFSRDATSLKCPFDHFNGFFPTSYTCDINAFNRAVCLTLPDSIDPSNRSHIPINRSFPQFAVVLFQVEPLITMLTHVGMKVRVEIVAA
mgnify:CR=1 FL=1